MAAKLDITAVTTSSSQDFLHKKFVRKTLHQKALKKIICLEHDGRNLFVTRWYLTQENQRCLLKAKTVATKQTQFL